MRMQIVVSKRNVLQLLTSRCLRHREDFFSRSNMAEKDPTTCQAIEILWLAKTDKLDLSRSLSREYTEPQPFSRESMSAEVKLRRQTTT